MVITVDPRDGSRRATDLTETDESRLEAIADQASGRRSGCPAWEDSAGRTCWTRSPRRWSPVAWTSSGPPWRRPG
ncbi:hypothetical protein NKG94_04675 [Micromonospora sp. M12]